ncbi:MAG TPA: lactate racemase domain-containing protein, partial [Bryobacterales bacterium]|nr:lactate racemase domain-containing protein [Bryobacterales bacterium]
MKLSLAFDKTGAEIELPEGRSIRVLRSRFADALDDPRRAIEAGLQNPIGCAPLEELAAGKRSAAISICDITRPAPNRIVLPPVIAALE